MSEAAAQPESSVGQTWGSHPTLQGVRVSRMGLVQTCWTRVRPNNKHGPCMAMTDSWRDSARCGVGEKRHYQAVCLYTVSRGREPRWKNHLVHKLVMETFVGPRPPGMCVCHNNGNPADNRLENLRYDTPKGNSGDAIRHGTQVRGSKHGVAKLDEEKVAKVLKLLFIRGMGCEEIAEKFGVSRVAIIYIRDGKTWTHVPRPY